MWKKTKLVILSSALAFSLTCSATKSVALADEIESRVTENVTQDYLKVTFENRILFHEQVPSKTIIQVLNTHDEVIKSEVLSGDTEIDLDTPKITAGNMLSYWSFKRNKDKLTIEPILIDEKDLSVHFYTTEGGELLKNNAQTKEIVKSVNKGTNLKDILPEVNPKKHYKFTGWFEAEEKVTDINDIKIMNSNGEYYAKFYPDLNNNNIDDRTEPITLKFVTNSKAKIKDVKTHVGNQIKLPAIEKKGFIFMGWYTDKKYKKRFKNYDILTKSLTLYAKWENADKVIKTSQTKPVTDRNVSDQIEKLLKERLNGLNNNSRTGYNNNATQTPNLSTSNDSGMNIPNDSDENQNNDSGVATQDNAFKETKYVFDNKNLMQRYMVKFFDKNEGFLFSLTLPYGKTIKTYDVNNQFHDEYSIRHDTTITLDAKEYINPDSVLLGFKTREVRVNSTNITEIYPEVTASDVNQKVAYYQKKEIEEQELENKKRKTIIVIATGALAIIGGVSVYFFLKRRKRAQEQDSI